MKLICLDFETHDPYIDRGMGAGWVYPLVDPNSDFEILGASVLEHGKPHGDVRYITSFKEIISICNSADGFIMHNASYDLGCLDVLGVDYRDKFIYDTEVLARLHNSTRPSYSLDNLAKVLCRTGKSQKGLADAMWNYKIYHKYKYKDPESNKDRRRPSDKTLISMSKKHMKEIQEADLSVMAEYCNHDVIATDKLFTCFETAFDSNYLRLGLKYSCLAKICNSYRKRGVKIDVDRCQEISNEMIPEIAKQYARVYDLAGKEYDILSAPQTIEVLTSLGIKLPQTEKGNYSADKKALESIDHPIAKAILDARKLHKIHNDFIKKPMELQINGRIYPELNLLRARTGRFSMANPNCFDKETEILTKSGWKLFKDLKKSDEVAQWDKGNISFVLPTGYIEKESEYIYDIKTDKGINLSVTEDHRLLLENRQGELNDHTVHDYKEDHKQLTSGYYETCNSNLNLDLIFAIQADGSLTKYGVDFCFKRQRKINRFKERIADLKEYEDGRHRALVRYNDIPDYVWNYIDRNTKKFLPSIVELSRKDILDYVMFWDGDWTRKAEWKSKYKSDCDNIQALLSCSNIRATLGTHEVNGTMYYVVRACNRPYYWTTNRTIEKRKYKDKVYCVSVPSSYILVRKGDSVAVTGQCQQIPSRDEKWGPICRSIYLPDEGEKWYSLDFSNQEGRLQVHFANQIGAEGASELVLEFKKNPNLDMHQKVADLAGITRSEAKTINLGLSYGMGIDKLAASLNLSTNKAKLLLNKFNTMCPYLDSLRKIFSNKAEEQGHIVSIGGRRLTFDSPHKVVNQLIQGSAADQIIESMIQAYKENLPVLFPVHDQICMSGTKEQAVRMKEIMETCIGLDIPSVVDVDLNGGENWADAGH